MDDVTFAEDSICNERGNLQADLDEFLDWSFSDHLKLNLDQCQAINICFIRNPTQRTDLKLGNTSLSYVHHPKVFSIYI